MICLFCGGEALWIGRLTDLKETKCQNCGETNCQEIEAVEETEAKDD
jgi:hypothetical protein